MNTRTSFLAFLVLASMVVAPKLQAASGGQSTSDEKSTIRYVVDLTDAKNHYLTITATVPATGDTTDLMMAVWTPGSYLVREYARHIDTIEVTEKGKHLEIEKTKKNRWRVQTQGVDSFDVKYHLYCNEMSVRTNWVGKQYAMINGAPTFITVPGRLKNPHEVQLKMPKGWTRSATSLPAVGDTPNTYRAKNFDELVDSPIVAGNISIYPFTASGVEHQLVNVGESGYWDGAKAATDLKRIVESHHEMWGVVPYDRYLFLNMICESGGGLEHNNSCMIMTSRWSFRDANRYKSWLSLASHEFFHTWNVRRLRPKSLVKYDYENEVYTESLWIAEGITSYYQDLLLVRAGLLSRGEYLGRLSRDVESVQRTHGRKLQSLKDSSYDAWIKYYRPDDNSSITRISYYSKGAVVAFLLDAKIRKLTQGKKSLDDVMRRMFKRYARSGYTPEQFRKTASKIAGEDLSDWFASAIDSTDELDFSDIDAIGVVVPNQKPAPRSRPTKSTDSERNRSSKSKSAKKTESKSPTKKAKASASDKAPRSAAGKSKPNAKSDTTEDNPKKSVFSFFRNPFSDRGRASQTPRSTASEKPWIGLSTSNNDGIVKVSGVVLDSPSYDAGMSLGDEVIAINGFRISRSVDSRLSQYAVGDEIEMLIARRGQLMTIRITLSTSETQSWRLRFVTRMSEKQKRQQDRWLGTD